MSTIKMALPRPESKRDWATLTAFVLMVLGIGSNVVAIRFSERSLPPFWNAGVRFGAASLIYLLYVALRGYRLPRGRALAGAVLFGALQFGVYFALIYFALSKVSAGLMAVILATSPIFTLLIASIARIERLTVRGVLGAAAALIGIAYIFGTPGGNSIPILYLLAAFAGVAVISLATVIFKLVPPVNPHVMNGVGMFIGSLILLGLSFATGEHPALPVGFNNWAVLVYMVLFGSVGLFALLLFVLKRLTASGYSYSTVLSPIVSILLSAWLLAEPVSGRLFGGTTLVLAGIYLGFLAPARKSGAKPLPKEAVMAEKAEIPCQVC